MATVGLWRARVVEMAGMPEMIALLHSFVGLAAVLVGWNGYLHVEADPGRAEGRLLEVYDWREQQREPRGHRRPFHPDLRDAHLWDADDGILPKRSVASGCAGVQNRLFFRDNTVMLVGDARIRIEDILRSP